MNNKLNIKVLKSENDFAGYDDDQIIKHLIDEYSYNGNTPEINITGDVINIVITDDTIIGVYDDYSKALYYCRDNKLDEAKSLLEEVIKKCPLFSEAYRILGQIAHQKGNNEEAINHCIDALRFNPSNEWALLLLGNIYNSQKDYKTALVFYKKIIAYHGDNAIALGNIGTMYYQLNDKASAKVYFERSIDKDPTYINAYQGLAMTLADEGDFTEAYHIVTKGLDKGVDKPQDRGARQRLEKLKACLHDYIANICDEDREIEMAKYRKSHPDGEDTDETIMMAMYMECALDELSELPDNVKKMVAMQIAQQGLHGIRPSNDGYKIKFFGNREFNGYALIAYYYVSWALAYPQDLDKLGLPYKTAYKLAKQRYDSKKH